MVKRADPGSKEDRKIRHKYFCGYKKRNNQQNYTRISTAKGYELLAEQKRMRNGGMV